MFLLMVILTGIVLCIHALSEYKYPKSLNNLRILKRVSPVLLLAGLSLIQYLSDDGYYLTYFLAVTLVLLVIMCLGDIVKLPYILFKSKTDPNFNPFTLESLFFLNFKIRNFCSTDQVSNTYFFKQDGLTVFFGMPNSSFQAMSANQLQTFKDSLTQPTMGHVKFGGFLVIEQHGKYTSLSSEEFRMMNIPITHINQDSFKVIEMLKI